MNSGCHRNCSWSLTVMFQVMVGNENQLIRGKCVKPEIPTDRTLATTVIGLVQDVLPQSAPVVNPGEKIIWVTFERCDINDPDWKSLLSELNGRDSPLIVALGLQNGYQLWALMSNGECEELLSVRSDPVKSITFIPCPEERDAHDVNVSVNVTLRPLIAVCDAVCPTRQAWSVRILSLRSGDEVACLSHLEPIRNVLSNKLVVVVLLARKIAVYKSTTFDILFTIDNANAEGPAPTVCCLGPNWLAYSDWKLNSALQSCGGVVGTDFQTYTSAVFSAAKNLGKNLTALGGQVVSQLGQTKGAKVMTAEADAQGIAQKIGIVTVVSLSNFQAKNADVHGGKICEGVVAHFIAYLDETIAHLSFNPSGSLLFTSGHRGHEFHLFTVLPHPGHPSLGAVVHLYTLIRGNTAALVQNVSFNHDSRWVAVTTFNGTTHVYPVTPYGGLITVRTHATPKVVNRQSRFHRSAGLGGFDVGRTPPSPPQHTSSTSPSGSNARVSWSGSPVVSGCKDVHPSVNSDNQSNSKAAMNPRLPPYEPPTVIQTAVKLKHEYSLSLLSGNERQRELSGDSRRRRASASQSDAQKLAMVFGGCRGWSVLNPGCKRDSDVVENIFSVNCQGELVEYSVAVKPIVLTPGTVKVPSDSPIDIKVVPTALWTLKRLPSSIEIGPRLNDKHPLLVADSLIQSSRNKAKEPSANTLVNWISQVEITTYSGPHRRLWMGPQFTFKTYVDSSSIELVSPTTEHKPGRSAPVAMPGGRIPHHSIPVIEGSLDNYDQPESSLVMDVVYGSWNDSSADFGDQSDHHWLLAEAMEENPHSSGSQGQPIADLDAAEEINFPISVDDKETGRGRQFDVRRNDSAELYIEARDC